MASLHSQGRWSAKDTLRLLECMEENLPSKDSRAFQKTQADLDWDKVAFEPFTGEMCRLKWQEISQKLRKFRTLSELVLEAKEQVTHPHKSGKFKKHPDFPKRPLTAYLRFYKEQRAQYLQMHPELNNKQLTRVLSEKYRQLPEQARQRYVQDFQKERQDFEEKVAQFREEHPDLAQKFKRRVAHTKPQRKVPEKLQDKVKNVSFAPEMDELSPKVKFLREPKKPPMNGYHKFHEDSWSSVDLCYLSPRERMVEIGRRWQRVPQHVKERYQSQAKEMEKQYWVDLDLWLKTLSPEEYALYVGAQACGKQKCTMVTDGPSPKFRKIDAQSSSTKELPELPEEKQGLLAPGSDSSETTVVQNGGFQRPGRSVLEDETEEEASSSSESTSGDEEDTDGSSEDSLSDSSSSGDSSDLASV